MKLTASLRSVCKFAIKWLLLLVGVPLLRALKVRFLVNPECPGSFSRIGHLALEPDCFVKEGLLGRRPSYRGILLLPPGHAANSCLAAYWKQHLRVVRSSFGHRLLARFAQVRSLQYRVDPYLTAIHETATSPELQAAWHGRPPLLTLTAAHRRFGENMLRKLGIPAGAWFVCVHCREGGYDGDDATHRLRNANIENYLPATGTIVNRGGWCIRVGDPTMKPLPSMPGVVDYAHSPQRSDELDVFLFASCRFFLGCASGPCKVALVFGRRTAVVNAALPWLQLGHGPDDLLIPKLLWSRRLGRYLTFAEIALSPLGSARSSTEIETAGVDVHENTPEDIRDLAAEMLDEMEGKICLSPADEERQRRARGLFRAGHYSYGAASRYGLRFLRKYQHLLPTACNRGAHYVTEPRSLETIPAPVASKS